MDDIDQVLGEALVAGRAVRQLGSDRAAVTQEPGPGALPAGVLRTLHTLSASSGVLGHQALKAVTDVSTGPLTRVRHGALVLTSAWTRVLPLVHDTRATDPSVVTVAEPRPDRAALPELLSGKPVDEPVAGASALLGEVLVEAGAADREDVALAVLEQSIEPDGRPIGQILVDHGQVAPAEITLALETQASRRAVADGRVDVDVDLLDALVRQVGELVLTCHQIARQSDRPRDLRLRRASRQLDLLAGTVRDGVATAHAQPVDHARGRLTRLVRDLATSDTAVRLGWRARTSRSRG